MRAFVALAALSLMLCSGCGGSSQATPATAIVRVKGTITFKGKPLTRGQVQFEPKDAGRDAYGKIQPDGTFVLTTFKEGDGAVKGVHRVSVNGAERHVRTKGETEVEVTDEKTDYTVDLK